MDNPSTSYWHAGWHFYHPYVINLHWWEGNPTKMVAHGQFVLGFYLEQLTGQSWCGPNTAGTIKVVRLGLWWRGHTAMVVSLGYSCAGAYRKQGQSRSVVQGT